MLLMPQHKTGPARPSASRHKIEKASPECRRARDRAASSNVHQAYTIAIKATVICPRSSGRSPRLPFFTSSSFLSRRVRSLINAWPSVNTKCLATGVWPSWTNRAHPRRRSSPTDRRQATKAGVCPRDTVEFQGLRRALFIGAPAQAGDAARHAERCFGRVIQPSRLGVARLRPDRPVTRMSPCGCGSPITTHQAGCPRNFGVPSAVEDVRVTTATLKRAALARNRKRRPPVAQTAASSECSRLRYTPCLRAVRRGPRFRKH